MTNKSSVRVNIFNKEYMIKGEADSDYIESLATYVDGKMREIIGSTTLSSELKVAILACMNIADEFYRAKKEIKLERERYKERENEAEVETAELLRKHSQEKEMLQHQFEEDRQSLSNSLRQDMERQREQQQKTLDTLRMETEKQHEKTLDQLKQEMERQQQKVLEGIRQEVDREKKKIAESIIIEKEEHKRVSKDLRFEKEREKQELIDKAENKIHQLTLFIEERLNNIGNA